MIPSFRAYIPAPWPALTSLPRAVWPKTTIFLTSRSFWSRDLQTRSHCHPDRERDDALALALAAHYRATLVERSHCSRVTELKRRRRRVGNWLRRPSVLVATGGERVRVREGINAPELRATVAQIYGRARKSWYLKINPVWWFMNDDEQTVDQAGYAVLCSARH